MISDDLYLFLYTILIDSISNAFLYGLIKAIELHFKKMQVLENETGILLLEHFRVFSLVTYIGDSSKVFANTV